jgi:hypothetical protein
MGYQRGRASLADMFPRVKATDELQQRLARRGSEVMRALAVEGTPVNTGNLAEHWKVSPLRKIGGSYAAGVYNRVSYAVHVEYGTGLYGPKGQRYLILPKKPGGVLSWVDKSTGQRRYSTRVLHPGSPGAYMLRNAALKTEATARQWGYAEIRKWKREQGQVG